MSYIWKVESYAWNGIFVEEKYFYSKSHAMSYIDDQIRWHDRQCKLYKIYQ